MNDYGLFKNLNTLFETDDFLSKRLLGFYTQTPVSVSFPYMLMSVDNVTTDGFTPPHKVTVEFKLNLFSRYPGLKEIHQLMHQVSELLEGYPVGNAVMRLKEQDIRLGKDERTREGVLIYQALVRQSGSGDKQ